MERHAARGQLGERLFQLVAAEHGAPQKYPAGMVSNQVTSVMLVLLPGGCSMTQRMPSPNVLSITTVKPSWPA